MTGGNSSGRSIYYTEDQIVELNDLISVNNRSIKLPNDFLINGLNEILKISNHILEILSKFYSSLACN